MPQPSPDGLDAARLLYGQKPNNGNNNLPKSSPTRKPKKPKRRRAELPVALIETPAGDRICRPLPEVEPSDNVIKQFPNYGEFNKWIAARRLKDGS